MATKINIDNIVNVINNTDNINILATNKRTKSDKKTDNTFSSIAEHFLPLFIVIAVEYYHLSKKTESLKTDVLNMLIKFRTVLLNMWFKEDDAKSTSLLFDGIESEENAQKRIKALPKVAKTLFERFPMHTTKQQFFSKNNVIEDDTSSEHTNAFAVDDPSQMPNENILIKLTDGQIHLRMGMKTPKAKREVHIIRIAEKKSNK